MATSCRTCEHRNDAVTSFPSSSSEIGVCLITLKFQTPVTRSPSRSNSYIALNTLLNNIIDNEDSASGPSTFTVWSPCSTDSKTILVITTLHEVCLSATSPIFDSIRPFLSTPPSSHLAFFDTSILALASSCPEQRICCDVTTLTPPNYDTHIAMGQSFGWDPKRSSSLSARLEKSASAGFHRPGDLIRDFWAFSEMSRSQAHHARSSSKGTIDSKLSSPSVLSLVGDEKPPSSLLPSIDSDAIEDVQPSLLMIFQWRSRADASRFKDSCRKSYGANGEEVARNFWESSLEVPVEKFIKWGASKEVFEVELRGVEERIESEDEVVRPRSGSKRLSQIASDLGDRVSGWLGRSSL